MVCLQVIFEIELQFIILIYLPRFFGIWSANSLDFFELTQGSPYHFNTIFGIEL